MGQVVSACGTTSVVNISPGAEKIISLAPLENCKWNYKTEPGYKLLVTCANIIAASEKNCANTVIIDKVQHCGTKRDYKYTTKSNTILIESKGTKVLGQFRCGVKPVYDPCACGRQKQVLDFLYQRMEIGNRNTYFQTRIVDGTAANLHEFPYQAALVGTDGSLQCGATISK